MTDPAAVAAAFTARFSAPPSMVLRVPGCVTLIGEHTAASLLPALVMAVDRELVIAAGPTDDGLITGYAQHLSAQIRFAAGDRVLEGWGRVATAAVAALGDTARGRGVHLLIDGTLPPKAGLNDTAALTAGIAATLARLWTLDLDRAAIAGIATGVERRLGAETGGEAQAAIAFGQAGHALHVAFEPFAVQPLALPAGLAVVVASSGEEPPAGEALHQLESDRVVGTRLAAALLAEMVGLDQEEAPTLARVADVDVVDILAEELPVKATPQEVTRSTGQLLQRLTALSHTLYEPKRAAPVRGPALHALSEARRVEELAAALGAGDLERAGRLLSEAQASLRDQLGCSTPALNQLCRAMNRAGALGARLMGPGFGGAVLAFAREESVAAVIEAAVAATGGPAFRVTAADAWS